jgi:hypothetical protein
MNAQPKFSDGERKQLLDAETDGRFPTPRTFSARMVVATFRKL